MGIEGAGIALCGAYAGMLAVMYVLTRKLFRVGFEWARLAQLVALLGAVAVSGELLLPTSASPACCCASHGWRCCPRAWR